MTVWASANAQGTGRRCLSTHRPCGVVIDGDAGDHRVWLYMLGCVHERHWHCVSVSQPHRAVAVAEVVVVLCRETICYGFALASLHGTACVCLCLCVSVSTACWKLRASECVVS